MTVLDAGFGAGKSVLLMQYARFARDAGAHVVHVYLSPAEPGIFAIYRRVRLALEAQGIVEPGDIPMEVPPGAHDLGVTSLRSLDAKLIVIVDNVRALDGEHPSLARAFANVLESLPNMHAVLAGRDLGEFRTEEYRMRSQPRIVHDEELAFTPVETRELTGRLLVESDSQLLDRCAEAVYAATAGWTTAVSTLLIDARSAPGPTSPSRVGDAAETYAGRHVRTHLAGLLPEDFETLLLAGSFPEVSMDVLRAVGISDPAACISRTAPEALMKREDSQGNMRFRVRRLLRAQAVRIAAEHLGAKRSAELFHAAAARLRREAPDYALRAAVLGSHWTLVNEIVHESHAEIGDTPATGDREHPLEGIPDAVLDRYPLLAATLLLEDVTMLRGKVGAYRGRLIEAERRLRVDSAKVGIAGVAAAAARMRLGGLLGDDELVGGMIRRVDETALRMSREEASRTLRSLMVTETHVAAAELRLLRFDAVFERCQRILNTIPKNQMTSIVNYAASLQLLSLALRGSLHEARFLLERWETSGRSLPRDGDKSSAGIDLAKAVILLEQGRAREAVELVRELQQHNLPSEYWVPLQWFQAQLIESLSGSEEALSWLERQLDARRGDHALLAVQNRRLDELLARLRYQAGVLELNAGEERRGDLVAVHQARAAGNPSRAATVAAAIAHEARRAGNVRRTVEALLLQAEAQRWLQDPGADQTSSAALRLATENALELPLRVLTVRQQPTGGVEGPAVDATGPRAGIKPLSPAEIRALRQVAVSGNAAAAAKSLFLSPYTVRAQLKSSYRKLGVSNRNDALRIAAALGVLGPEGAGTTPAPRRSGAARPPS